MAAKLQRRQRLHPRRLPRSRCSRSARWARSSKLLGMLPGMGADARSRSTTSTTRHRPHRRDHPVDDPGRARRPEDHQRLAPGPHRQGLRRRSVAEVNSLVDRFFEARKMMRRWPAAAGCPGMPGMPGHGRRRGRASKKQQAGQGQAQAVRQPDEARRRRSRPRAERRALGPAGAQARGGGAFGLGAGKGPADFELPKEFKDLL